VKSPSPPGAGPTPERAAEVVELSRFRADLGRGRRLRRADALLESSDPGGAIRALPPDEFYYVIHELGFPDAQDVLAHGTVEQVQAALDFALWERDVLSPERVEEWLAALVEAPHEKVVAWAKGLDVELLALLLRRRARIYDLSLEEPPDEPEGSFHGTPDGLFVLDFRGDDDQRQVTGRLLDALYRQDHEWVRRILVGTRGDLDAELEEHAYRWRSGRMADFGFEDYYDALEVYRELDPGTVAVGDQPSPRVRPLTEEADERFLRVPTALAERLASGSPFARAVAGVTSKEELDNLHAGLVTLSNRVLAADRVTPGDDETAAAVLGRMAATLDLAVEFLARGRPEQAVQAVRTLPLPRVFQVGVSLVGKLRKLALTLSRKNPFAALRPEVELSEPEDAEVLEAFTRLRPLFPRSLDEPPAGGERPFASLADLARGTAALERAGAALALLHVLGVRPEHLAPGAPEALALGDPGLLDTGLVARTLLARRWLWPAAVALRPLDAGEAGELESHLKNVAQDADMRREADRRLREDLARLWPGGRLSPAAEAIADRWIGGLLAGAPVLVRPRS
jgi:hypothetical protein